MRSLICGIVLLSIVAGCTNSSDTVLDEETLTISESQPEPLGEVAREERGDKPRDEFGIGAPAPKFADLIGVDDKKYSLDDFKDAKAVAVVFTCNKCPVAVYYEDRLKAYQKDYADKGVQLVAINVNNAEEDKLPAMKVRAKDKEFAFPYLYDESQKSARDYGATVTPHVYLLDSQRNLAFVGPVDDNPEGTQVTKSYLREATDAVLAGEAVDASILGLEVPGCGIQYE